MKLKDAKKSIYDTLKKKKSITAQQLNYTPLKIPYILSYAVLEHLKSTGTVTKKGAIYTVIDQKKQQ